MNLIVLPQAADELDGWLSMTEQNWPDLSKKWTGLLRTPVGGKG